MKRIDLETHFYIPELLAHFTGRDTYPVFYPEKQQLLYCEDYLVGSPDRLAMLLQPPVERIKIMDENEIAVQLLSVSPGIEVVERVEDAVSLCRLANTYIRRAMTEYPGRFSGYAMLPYQDVGEAVKELEFCVKEWNFCGILAFSNFGPTSLDDPRYLPILAKAAELDVPVYLHPLVAYEGRQRGFGKLLACASFGFAIDVSTTLLRMIMSGCFDIYPNLKVIIGHLGEGFPFILQRLDVRSLRGDRHPAVNKELVSYYFKNNIWVTSSGVFSKEAFQCTRDVLGLDRIMLAGDYPYESYKALREYADNLPLSLNENKMFLSGTAEKLFGGAF